MAPLQEALASFAHQILSPDCCSPLVEAFQRLDSALKTFQTITAFLGQQQSLPDISDDRNRVVYEKIKGLTNKILCIHEELIKTPKFDCQNTGFVLSLSNLAEQTQNAVDSFTGLITSVLGWSPPVVQTPSLSLDSSCLKTEVFLSRCLHHLAKIPDQVSHTLDLLWPKPDLIYPNYFPIVTALRENLSPAVVALSDALHLRLLTLNTENLCLPHNVIHTEQCLDQAYTFLALLAPSSDTAAKQLDQFKFSGFGHAVHKYRETTNNLQTLLGTLASVAPTRFQEVASNLSSVPTELLKAQRLWQKTIDSLGNENDELSQLNLLQKHFEQASEILLNFISTLESLSQQFAADWHSSTLPPIIFCEEQIYEDLDYIRNDFNTINEIIANYFCDAFINTQILSLDLGDVFQSLEGFYNSLPERVARIQLLSPFPAQILGYHQPKENLPLLCHHLWFALTHSTCCEQHFQNLNVLQTTFSDVLLHLNLVASGNTTPEQNLTKEEILGNILNEISSSSFLIQEGTALLQNCLLRIEQLEFPTCFTESNPEALQPLSLWSENLTKITEHLLILAQNRAALYDLGNEKETTFLSLASQWDRIAPYYNEDIARLWMLLNNRLAEQNQTLNQMKALLKAKTLCFFHDAAHEYLSCFDIFQPFSSYIQSSTKALKFYKQSCYLRNTQHLSRIYQHLIHLSKIKELTFRNITFADTKTVLNLCKTVLSSLIIDLTKLPSQLPHSFDRFRSLGLIEQDLNSLHQSLDSYLKQYAISMTISCPDITSESYESLFSHLGNYLSTKLVNDFKEWLDKLSREDGLNDNERCYSESVSELCNLLGSLADIFEGLPNNPLVFCDKLTEGSEDKTNQGQSILAAACTTAANGIRSIQALCKSVDSILKNPTCCRQRAETLRSLAVELEGLHRCLSGAFKEIDEELLSDSSLPIASFAKNIQKTTTLMTSLCTTLSDLDIPHIRLSITSHPCTNKHSSAAFRQRDQQNTENSPFHLRRSSLRNYAPYRTRSKTRLLLLIRTYFFH